MQPPRARMHIPPMGVCGAVATPGRPLSPLSAARASPVAARRRDSCPTSPRLYPPTRRGRACPRGPQHARSTWEARHPRRRRPSRSRGGCSTGDARTPDLPALARAADPIGCESLGIDLDNGLPTGRLPATAPPRTIPHQPPAGGHPRREYRHVAGSKCPVSAAGQPCLFLLTLASAPNGTLPHYIADDGYYVRFLVAL